MVQANDVVRPMSRHSERTPLVLGGTQLHGEPINLCVQHDKKENEFRTAASMGVYCEVRKFLKCVLLLH